MNDDVMNAIRGSVTKLLATDSHAGGAHATPADVVAAPSSAAHGALRGGGPQELIAARMELDDLRVERTAKAAAMEAEIAAASTRLRSENERARIAAEKADAEAARVAAALQDLRKRELRLEEREESVAARERRVKELERMEAELAERETAAMAAEDAVREAEDAVGDKLELAERATRDAERRDEEARAAFDALAAERDAIESDLETLEVRRQEILHELAQREVEAEAKVEDVMERARRSQRATDRAASEQRSLIEAVESVRSALVLEEEKLQRCKETLEAHEREERDIAHKLEHVRRLAKTQESGLHDAEALRKQAQTDFEGETREWTIRVDAQKREHESAVARLEALHREAAGLEREASDRRLAYEAERLEFREELDGVKKAWEKERAAMEAEFEGKEREQRRRVTEFEDTCRGRTADWETECRYKQEELRDERNKLEDTKAELGRREEAVEDLMRRSEKDIADANAVLQGQRAKEAELEKRRAALTAAEDAQEVSSYFIPVRAIRMTPCLVHRLGSGRRSRRRREAATTAKRRSRSGSVASVRSATRLRRCATPRRRNPPRPRRRLRIPSSASATPRRSRRSATRSRRSSRSRRRGSSRSARSAWIRWPPTNSRSRGGPTIWRLPRWTSPRKSPPPPSREQSLRRF